MSCHFACVQKYTQKVSTYKRSWQVKGLYLKFWWKLEITVYRVYTDFPPTNKGWIFQFSICLTGLPWVVQTVKRLPAVRETWVQSLGQEDPLKKEIATHSSILALKISWTEKPGGLQSIGSQSDMTEWLNTTTPFYIKWSKFWNAIM